MSDKMCMKAAPVLLSLSLYGRVSSSVLQCKSAKSICDTLTIFSVSAFVSVSVSAFVFVSVFVAFR